MSIPASKSGVGAREEIKIEYRPDGKIPIGIWLVWVSFAIFAVYYGSSYVWPDFVHWMSEVRPH
ncbi:MAG: hypothetical protein JNJ88_11140 [Planctomycetes bacterium]|nr:hypothetical protein [Planctomycetota bacterium]